MFTKKVVTLPKEEDLLEIGEGFTTLARSKVFDRAVGYSSDAK